MMKLNAVAALFTELVLGCRINPLELLFRPWLKGPVGLDTTAGASQFAGRTTLASGTAFATVSTAMVNSDSIISLTFQVSTTCGSGTGYGLAVSSVRSGISFAVGYYDGQGRAPGGTVMWEIKRTT